MNKNTNINGIIVEDNSLFAEILKGIEDVKNGTDPALLWRDRAKGMLWGLLVGDALGSPIQFSSKDGHPHITEMVPCPVFNVPAGYWTDDGSMALCIMDSYVRKGGVYDREDIGATFVKWYREGYLSSIEGRAFDVGITTSQSIAGIARGSLVNGTDRAQGNGSLMRFAPSWLIAFAEDRRSVYHEISDLTHASDTVRMECEKMDSVLETNLRGVRSDVGPGAETARADVPNSGWCVDTLKAAEWAFNTTQTFEDGMVAAVNLGGDSDTIGAVYGQIAGAFYGYSAIPKRWVKAMKDWEKLDALIEQFLGLVVKKMAIA
jgi:ADP-ribosyl-[dinitrogen reductase] hydrolase